MKFTLSKYYPEQIKLSFIFGSSYEVSVMQILWQKWQPLDGVLFFY